MATRRNQLSIDLTSDASQARRRRRGDRAAAATQAPSPRIALTRAEAAKALQKDFEVQVRVRRVDSDAEARRLIDDEEADVALVDGGDNALDNLELRCHRCHRRTR